jgi:hypothetical protein
MTMEEGRRGGWQDYFIVIFGNVLYLKGIKIVNVGVNMGLFTFVCWLVPRWAIQGNRAIHDGVWDILSKGDNECSSPAALYPAE